MRNLVKLLVLGAVLFSSPAVASNEWRIGGNQGVIEHTVSHGPGNDFVVVCDEGYSDTGELTGLIINIKDRSAPANSTVKVFVDGDEFEFFNEAESGIKTDNRVSANNFYALWSKMRTSSMLIAVFEDGRTASFNIKGADKALGSEVCKTAF